MKVVPSKLYTTEAESLQKEVEDELTIPDPEPNVATAAIEEANVVEE
jgi:hypothetical protein